jgi:hypothetical protein
MNEWINALSLKVSTFAVLLASVSFLFVGMRLHPVVLAALFFVTSTTMLQNDWRDRVHDMRKNEMLVGQNQHTFLSLVVFAWFVTAVLIMFSFRVSHAMGILLASMAIVGLIYSEVRQMPFLPITLVVATSASPALLPVVTGAHSDRALYLSAATVLIIFAREITRDIEDQYIDPGYKWTIPVRFGERRALVVAVLVTVIGLLLSIQISWWAVPGALIASYGVGKLARGASTLIARTIIDIGIVVVLLTLLFIQIVGAPL